MKIPNDNNETDYPALRNVHTSNKNNTAVWNGDSYACCHI